MVASSSRLISQWLHRLARLRDQRDDPALGDTWLCAIRIRVLTFLLTRYEAGPDAPPLSCSGGAGLGRFAPPQGPPEEPIDHPPRIPAELALVLRDIARCNQASRPRWRFWF